MTTTPPLLSEARLQSDCFLWFHNSFPAQRQMLFHVQNKARNAIEGNKFKSMGVVRGVSDLILILPGRVVFIELKVGDGKQSPEQVAFEYKVLSRGHTYWVIRSLVEFQSLVTELLGANGCYTMETLPPSFIG